MHGVCEICGQLSSVYPTMSPSGILQNSCRHCVGIRVSKIQRMQQRLDKAEAWVAKNPSQLDEYLEAEEMRSKEDEIRSKLQAMQQKFAGD